MGEKILTKIGNGIKEKVIGDVLNPINEIVDDNIKDISTTIGSFVVRSVRGKFQRSITFSIGNNYGDGWMEEALYGILYQYNDIKKSSKLNLYNKKGVNDGSAMYYQLDDGAHNLKYRDYNILLVIQTISASAMSGRVSSTKKYTIITYDLDPKFVKLFEKDMLMHRNSILKIRADSPTVNVYQDYHESDGWTYWEKILTINKRKLDTIYLPEDIKSKIVNTVNDFFANKEYYRKHGIAHNLKILLYGEPGPQPFSSLIPTPNGIKKMEDIKPGDYVFSLSGTPTLVEEIYDYSKLPVYEVKFSDGRTVKCGIDHQWPIITSRGNIINKSVKEMLDDGIKGNNNDYKFQIPIGGEAEYKRRNVPIDPWVIGALISNGNLRQTVLTLSSQNAILPSYMAQILGFKIKRRSESVDDYNWKFYTKDGKPVNTKEFLKSVPNLIDSYSGDKFIPEEYLFNDRNTRYKLLQGLMDTDGSIRESNSTNCLYKRYDISYSTTSKRLAEQIVFLVNSLGFAASISIDNRKDKYTTGFCATISIRCSDHDKYLFFRYSNKIEKAWKARLRKNFKKSERLARLSIIDIKELNYDEPMRCLHVKDSMHIYQSTGFIPTCNCGKDSITKMIASEWNRNIFYVTGGKDGKFIPNAITSSSNDMIAPLLLISDIDKYPFLINEPDIDIEKAEGPAKEEAIKHKQLFGSMINALDGILSPEDRIIVMTTNHREKFSPVLTRPGRIDLDIEIPYINEEVFRKYVYDFYGVEIDKNTKLKKNNITIANLQFDVVFLKLRLEEFLNKYTK